MRNGIADRLSAVTCKCGTVLDTCIIAVARHARQMQQDRKPGRALHQRADRRTAQSEDEISFPVARHCPVSDLGRTLTDHDLGGDEGFAPSARPGSRHTQCPSCAQTGGQLAAQRTATLHIEGLINRLMADTHRFILGEVDRQTAGNLFRAPSRGPTPVLPASRSPSIPSHLWPGDPGAIWCSNRPRQPILHVVT